MLWVVVGRNRFGENEKGGEMCGVVGEKRKRETSYGC